MLVNSVAYKDGRKIADVPREQIHDYLRRGDCIVWVAVRDPEPHELDRLEEEFDLPPLAIEDARHGHQRPKFEEYGDSLFFVLHMIEPDGDDLRVGEVEIFVGRNYVLSVRSRSERSPRSGALRVALHRARRRLRDFIREQLQASGDDAACELGVALA